MFFCGFNLTQQEVGIELNCTQATAKRRCDRYFKELAKDLHAKIYRDEYLSIELLDIMYNKLELGKQIVRWHL